MEMFCLTVYPNELITTPCQPTKYYSYPPSVTIDSHRPLHFLPPPIPPPTPPPSPTHREKVGP